MISTHYRFWRKIFLFSLGLFLAAGFCMKWMEPDFMANGQPFTIIGLEISYSQQQVSDILSGLSDPIRQVLRYHLSFDFAFMLGVYPGIAALCMMGYQKAVNRTFKKVLVLLALLQIPAFGCDIMENMKLFQWIRDPRSISGFSVYHFIVMTKWILALAGALTGIGASMIRLQKPGAG